MTRLQRIEALLDTLPTDAAERLRRKFDRVLADVWQLHSTGTDPTAIKAYIRSPEAWA
ncbi:hypothetical protein [Mesorhizobium sp. Cs1321R2N1]|uniref:hypothetical protein n=1 Tax=Mesorhizobium sp. Cs1321R2N1 TaxID=3015174 RepID=UPI00301D41DC